MLDGYEELSVRRTIIHVVGQLCDPLQCLADHNAYVRQAAIEALGTTGNIQAIPLLTPALADKVVFVRQAAIEALGKIGDKQAISLLTPLLTDFSEIIRESATRVVAQLQTVHAGSHFSHNPADYKTPAREIVAEVLEQQEYQPHDRAHLQRIARTLSKQLRIRHVLWKQLWEQLTDPEYSPELNLTAIEATFLSLEQIAHHLVVLDVQALPKMDPLERA
jgi:HEAT repeat protein